MVVRIEPGDREKIARSLGKSGKPAPDWVTGDPGLHAAYRDAAGLPALEEPAPVVEPLPKDSGGRQSNPARKPAARPRAARPASRPRATKPRRLGAGRVDRANASLARLGARTRTSWAGTGGGLLMAVWLYPIGLAILQHGPSGASMWLKAKFLNDVPAPATPTPPYPYQPPGTPGRRWPNGQLLPGQVPNDPNRPRQS